MLNSMEFPPYILIEEESRTILVAAEELSGFFGGPSEPLSEVVFLRIHEINEGVRRTDDAVLEVVNFRGERIGEYFIGRSLLGGVVDDTESEGISSASFRFHGNHSEYPEAAMIWTHWATAPSLQAGEWRQQPESYQAAWLHVVQNSWFAKGRRAARYGPNAIVNLDGADITSKPGFYCALGEAVNGTGGYFGSNLDALAECMSSRHGEGPLRGLVWRNFPASQDSLSDDFVCSITALMEEFSVDFTIL